MSTGAQGPPVAFARNQIKREIVRVHADSYGTEAGKVAVHLNEDSVFVVIDELELSTLEHSLLEAGYPEAIRALREEYETTIEPTFRALVERATGREVIGFLSAVSTSPPYAVAIFRLAA